MVLGFGTPNTYNRAALLDRLPAEAYCNQPPGHGDYGASASVSLSGGDSGSGGDTLLSGVAVQVQIGSGGCVLRGLPRMAPGQYAPGGELRWSLTLRAP